MGSGPSNETGEWDLAFDFPDELAAKFTDAMSLPTDEFIKYVRSVLENPVLSEIQRANGHALVNDLFQKDSDHEMAKRFLVDMIAGTVEQAAIGGGGLSADQLGKLLVAFFCQTVDGIIGEVDATVWRFREEYRRDAVRLTALVLDPQTTSMPFLTRLSSVLTYYGWVKVYGIDVFDELILNIDLLEGDFPDDTVGVSVYSNIRKTMSEDISTNLERLKTDVSIFRSHVKDLQTIDSGKTDFAEDTKPEPVPEAETYVPNDINWIDRVSIEGMGTVKFDFRADEKISSLLKLDGLGYYELFKANGVTSGNVLAHITEAAEIGSFWLDSVYPLADLAYMCLMAGWWYKGVLYKSGDLTKWDSQKPYFVREIIDDPSDRASNTKLGDATQIYAAIAEAYMTAFADAEIFF
jgi:hypothetical protein